MSNQKEINKERTSTPTTVTAPLTTATTTTTWAYVIPENTSRQETQQEQTQGNQRL